MREQETEFTDQFKNKSVEQFTVTKTGSQSDSEINALSGATVTSNAVTNAVNAALKFVQQTITGQNMTIPSSTPGSIDVTPSVDDPAVTTPEIVDPAASSAADPAVTTPTDPVVATPEATNPAATTPAAVNVAPVE